MRPIFVRIYTRCYLRILRFVVENPVYQNRGEADSNESPEYLEELFKTVLLLVVVAVILSLKIIGLTLAKTILSFVNHTDLNSTKYKIIANAALILPLANSCSNTLIILHRNKKSRNG